MKLKSNKQRRAEIMAVRRKRADAAQAAWRASPHSGVPSGAVATDRSVLALRNPERPLFDLPNLYLDKIFACRNCKVECVWTAKQQKWWYELAGGSLYTHAVRCRPCRQVERDRLAHARACTQAGQDKRTTKNSKS
ncbi:MAG: zinc-ribbon domain containing protein [Pseudomonadota bacterium]